MNNSHLDYQSAVKQAKEFITNRRFENGFDLATPEGYKSSLADFVGKFCVSSCSANRSGILQTGEPGELNDKKAQDDSDRYVDSIIKGAETDALIFQAILLGTASEVEKGEVLHPKLRTWIVQYLRGKISPPQKRKGRMESTGLHNIIAHAVADLVESGMQPTTRGEASPAVSACDAVADALGQLKINSITFQSVKRIWFDWDKSFWIG